MSSIPYVIHDPQIGSSSNISNLVVDLYFGDRAANMRWIRSVSAPLIASNFHLQKEERYHCGVVFSMMRVFYDYWGYYYWRGGLFTTQILKNVINIYNGYLLTSQGLKVLYTLLHTLSVFRVASRVIEVPFVYPTVAPETDAEWEAFDRIDEMVSSHKLSKYIRWAIWQCKALMNRLTQLKN